MPEIPPVGQGMVGQVNRAVERLAVTAAGRQERDGHEPVGDRVELSQVAQWLDRIRQLPEVRQDLIDDLKQAIEAGTYETPEKLDAAVAALLDEI